MDENLDCVRIDVIQKLLLSGGRFGVWQDLCNEKYKLLLGGGVFRVWQGWCNKENKKGYSTARTYAEVSGQTLA